MEVVSKSIVIRLDLSDDIRDQYQIIFPNRNVTDLE